MNIINMNTGTPSTLTLNPTVDKSTTNTLILGGGGLGVINVVKVGAFAQTLSGANTYAGSTTISGGSLIAGVSNVGSTSGAFGPTGTVTLGDAATNSNNSSVSVR